MQILLAIVVLGAIGMSFLLVPDSKDVALLQLKSNNVEAARDSLREQLESGDRSVQVVASLAEIAVHDGQIDEAVRILEEYVRNVPKDIAAKRRLAEYYRFAQRRNDYVATLAEVVQFDGRPEERKLLVNLYRLRGEHEKLRSALRSLIEHGLGDPAHYLESAQYAAASDDPREALAMLERMWDRYPDSFTLPSVRLYAMMAAAFGYGDRGEAIVLKYRTQNGNEAIVPIIREAMDRGYESYGVTLLASLEGELYKVPPLLVMWAQLQIALDHETVAFQRFVTLFREGNLPELAVPVLIEMALRGQDLGLVEELLVGRDISGFPEYRLLSLGDAAVLNRRITLLDQFLSQAPGGFRAARPAMMANVNLELGNVDAARRLVAGIEPATLGTGELIRLARALIGLGQGDRASRVLAEIAARPDLDEATVNALASFYLTTGRTVEGLATFDRLRRRQPSPAVEGGWARLAALAGKDDELVAWLGRAPVLDRDLVEELVSLAASNRAPRAALLLAERMFRERPDTDARRLYGRALVVNGRAEQALPILQDLLPGSAEDAESWVEALVAANRKPEALEFLRRRAEAGPLPVLIADDFMALAIELDRSRLAYAETRRQDPKAFPGDTMASVAENAALDGDFELIDWMLEKLGRQFMETRPVMAARIAMARGDKAAAREWVGKAEKLANLSVLDRLDLARVYLDLDEPAKALTLLERLAGDAQTPPSAIGDLATLYLELGKAQEGLPVLRALAKRRDELLVREGWARLETKAGNPADVLAWLKRTERPSRQLLLDLYYIGDERKADDLSFAAAERLHRLFPGNEAALVWGRALTAAGRGPEAVAVLKPLLPGDRAIRAAYVAALGRGGSPEELRRFAEGMLKDPSLDAETREALLFSLLDAGAADIALPLLRDLARSDPAKWQPSYLQALRLAKADTERGDVIAKLLDAGPPRDRRDALLYELLDISPAKALPYLERTARAEPSGPWPAAYEDALAKLGRNDSLVGWLATRATDRALPPEARRAASFRLLDIGAKPQAETGFRMLAETAPPESPDVRQLVYLWGPRPPQRGIAWLSGRALAADGAEKAGWLGLLNDVGAYTETIAVAGGTEFADATDPVLKPLAEAMLVRREFDALGRLLAPLVDPTGDEQALLRIADWAAQSLQRDVEVRTWDKLVASYGNDPEKLLAAGRAFTFAGRAQRAVDALDRFFRVASAEQRADHKPWYYQGQSLSALNRPVEAREAYRQMLARIDANRADDFESRRMKATGLQAIGEDEQAIGVYEQLLAERPDDRSLVADFVALLIETERFERADALLRQN